MKVMPVIKDIHKAYFYQNCESCISQVFLSGKYYFESWKMTEFVIRYTILKTSTTYFKYVSFGLKFKRRINLYIYALKQIYMFIG